MKLYAQSDEQMVKYHRSSVKVYKDKLAKGQFKSETFDFENRIGHKIGNQAVLIKESEPYIIESSDIENWPHDIRRETVVLCSTGGYQPFATWLRVVGVGLTASGGFHLIEYCIHGHYYTDIEKAMEDYNERVEQHDARNQ